MRTCPPALLEFFDRRTGVLAVNASPVPLLLTAARSCVGITEASDPVSVNLFRSVIGKPVGQSWCLDFIQACIAYVEARTGAQSSLPATELVMALWDSAKALRAVPGAEPGDLVIWQLGQTIHGHVGLVAGIDSLRYMTYEGNTSDSAEIDREGRGVFQKNRAKGGSRTFKEVGFLRVFE